MQDNSMQKGFFVALLLFVTLAFLWLIRGFLQPIFWAVAFAIVIAPLYDRILTWMRGRENLAALVTVVLVVVLVILPVIGVAAAVTSEAAGLYQRWSTSGLQLEGLFERVEQWMPQATGVLERFGFDPSRLSSQISSAAVAASQFMASRALAIGQDTVRITVLFFLMLYLLYFFLRDGSRLVEGMIRVLPLGDARERHLMARFAEVSRATIKGTLVVGIAQGAIGGIAFALLGIGAPVLWGVVMAVLSILPAIGTALIWGPAAIWLLFSGRIVAGIVLIFVGVVVIGLTDNFLRPLLVGRDTRMPDYLILLATLGGLTAFGLAGIIAGPIIAAFFLSVWQMAHTEFQE
jgi:predicted PurR-regulated permease PerM